MSREEDQRSFAESYSCYPGTKCGAVPDLNRSQGFGVIFEISTNVGATNVQEA